MKLTLTIFLFFCVFGVKAQTISTFAGGGTSLGDGGPATSALINGPASGAIDKFGNYYVTESIGHRIRKISPSGIINTVVGIGSSGFSGDGGPAIAAKISQPGSVVFDTSGNMYISDFNNFRIRKIDIATGIITTIAGNGIGGFYGEGILATSSQIWGVEDICFDKAGNLYLADRDNYRVRKISTLGIISTIAGNGSFSALGTGDGGPAWAATFNFITGIATDDTGNIYVADYNAGKVRKINTSGIITTVAGNGSLTFMGDGIPATDAQINPVKICFDNSGCLVIGDFINRKIFKVDKLGIIHTIVGTGGTGLSGDGGPATAATTDFPSGVVYDRCGNLFIAEASTKRVRKVASGTTISPTISITSGTSYASGSTVTVTAAVTDTCASYLIHWLNKGVVFATTTTTSVTYTKGAGIDTITARVVPQCGSCYDSTTSLKHIVYNTALGVNSVGVQPVRVYPNPAQSELTITAGTKITGVTISNIIGRQVYSHEYNTENVTLNIAHLPAGVYTLKITGDGWQEVRKVVNE